MMDRPKRGIAIGVTVAVLALAVMGPLLAGVRGQQANTLLTLATYIFMFTALASAWNLVGGFAGQLSLGHAAFYGLGTYAAAIAFKHWGWSGWWGLLTGPLVAIPVAWFIGWVTFRLRGPYFTLATIAFGEILVLLAKNFPSITGGPVGVELARSRPWQVLGTEPAWLLGNTSKVPYYLIALLLAVLTVGIAYWIHRSKMGYYLQAIREDHDASETLGINTSRYKNYALIIGAMLCAMVGAFAGNFQKHVEPNEYLAIHLSVEFVLIAVIGGLGTVPGPVVGGIVLTYLKRSLFRDLFGQANLLIYGLLLILVILFMPEGLWGLIRLGWTWLQKKLDRRKEADHATA